MPQSKEVKREQARLRMRKMRNKGVTKQGVTRIEFIRKELNDDYLIKGIEAASLRFNDRDARYERAYRYFRWRNGEVIETTMPFALVYDRTRLEKITEKLKEFKQETNVYYGCGKDSIPFDVVGDYLEATR